jgi:hypothetical protein
VAPGSDDASTDLALRSYRQGDVLPKLSSLAMLRVQDDGQSRWVEESAPNGAVIISQTCDVVRPHRERPTVQASKLTQLAGVTEREAAEGRRPRFVAVPNEGTGWFADLEVIGTIDKLALVRLSRREGVIDDEQVRTFAGAVGRRFSRFPFPDEVAQQISVLERDVRSKYGKELSPLGRILRQVMELRLEADPTWEDPDAAIRLVVICNPGVLGTFEQPPQVPTDLAKWLGLDAAAVATRSPTEIAGRLLVASPGSVEAWHLWDQLGHVWARSCSQVNPTEGTGRPHQFDAEVLSADEFTLDRVRRSEILDVDYLSPPTP